MDLRGKHIVLGLTGGIACYKSAELVRLLTKAGATVQVAMTEAATHFITPVTMQALSGRPVFLSQWDARIDNNMAHIDLSREADAIVIAPASTDFMARLANGLCDDLLSTLCIARDCPLLVAPAMNRQMWAAPATQRNAAQLRADGVTILGPGSGDQACGEVGDGRMLEPEELLDDIIAFFQPKPLQGKRVLITAGPTFEAIDPVRGITNLSSGKMGFSIARAAREAGAEVLLVAGPTGLPTPRGVLRTDVRSAQQMHDAVIAQLHGVDVFVAVAAVADWRPAEVAQQKLKKANDTDTPTLQFVQNPDILATVAARADAPYCVGFAAESEKLAQHARAKRAKKGIPLLAANLAQGAIGSDDNDITLFDDAGEHPLGRGSKLELARRLVAHIAGLLAGEKRARAKA